jgi:type I restriction enzyme S subunit
MKKTKLKDVIQQTISGEWGEEDEVGNGTLVLRTTNFTNHGVIDYSKVVTRKIEKDKINQKRLLNDDIIIEKSGGGPNTPVGRVVLFKEKDNYDYLSNNFTAIIRSNKDKINPEYLFYQLFYFYKIGKVKKYQNQTTGIYNLKLGRYLNEDINLPDLATQAKIVNRIKTIQEINEKRKEMISLIDSYISSTFIEMFLQNEEKKDWKIDTINKLNIIRKSVYGTAKKANSDSLGLPVLRMNNINYLGDICVNDIKWIELSEIETNKLLLENRSVLFNRTNSPDLVGKVAVWDKGSGYTFAGYLINLKLNEKIISPYYFASYFNSHFGKVVLQSKARHSGNLANISATTLKNQKILLPPIDIQNEFEKIYLKAKDLQLKLTLSLNELTEYFDKTLHDTFNQKFDIDDEKGFEGIIKDLRLEDLKDKRRLDLILKLFNKRSQFSDFNNYDGAYDKIMELLETEVIEQYRERDIIKLRIKNETH